MNDYNFDLNLSNDAYTLEIDTSASYGYFQNNTTGTEGGLWFDGLTLVDYDGVTELPKTVATALNHAGFNLEGI